ncbi:MAG: histidinol-phosphate transaminase [Spirochaeta sp. LUC14_002_19_P3]|nr:MAG: histidinol-phosphate transaminase [Spirochaeta sp. LUC14_002_19_P3]
MKLKANIASLEAYSPGKTAYGAEKLSSNENPLGPSPKARQAIEAVLGQIHRYPDGASTELRRRLAALWNTVPENLIIGSGSDEVFSLIAAAWLASGENAVSAKQTFSQYRYAVTLFGGTMREANLKEGKYNPEKMAALTDSQTRIVFICNPNNPTGTYLNANELAAFIDLLPKDIIIVIDEAYADFADAPDFPNSKQLLRQYDNIVITRTFSKLYGIAGLRVGYGIGSAEICQGAERASMPFNVNVPAQAAACAALDDAEHRQATLELVRREKDFLYREFTRRGYFFYPTQANFICFNAGKPASELWEFIARRGISIRDLNSFGLPDMVRYTIGRREHNERLLAILDELKHHV